nr:replication protein A 70 kDa DNA-binding subunit B [Tanacetum cinerariifolium]
MGWSGEGLGKFVKVVTIGPPRIPLKKPDVKKLEEKKPPDKKPKTKKPEEKKLKEKVPVHPYSAWELEGVDEDVEKILMAVHILVSKIQIHKQPLDAANIFNFQVIKRNRDDKLINLHDDFDYNQSKQTIPFEGFHCILYARIIKIHRKHGWAYLACKKCGNIAKQTDVERIN